MRAAKRTYLPILLVFLTITVMFPRIAWAQVTALDEVRFFLRNYYVEPVQEDVLDSPNIDTLIYNLNDPYTYFMTTQQYEDFENYVEQRFSGIGIYVDLTEEGCKVTGLISDSPAAKSGLQGGDLITAVDNHPVQGLSLEELLPLIRGPEGSSVQINYLRSGLNYTVLVKRASFLVPTVTSEMKPFNTGYIGLSSFAGDTGSLFGNCLDKLRLQNPQAYIVDLRDNGGGYAQTALEIAGYFIGDDLAMQVYHRNSPPFRLRAVKQDYIVDRPTILLVNHYSASASEALAMAIKDHGKAVLVGTQTYGKGCGQQIFPLSSGGYLKMTTSLYRSPLSVSINNKGITPDLTIEKTDPLKVSLLLLSGKYTGLKNGLVKLQLASQSFYIDTRAACQPEYWAAYGEILDKIGLGLMQGNGLDWERITQPELTDRRSLYYPGYRLGTDALRLTDDSSFTLHFPQSINWQSISPDNIELIASGNGERIPLAFTQVNGNDIKVTAQQPLLADTSYWLVIHPGISYDDGSLLQSGMVCTAALKSPEASNTNEPEEPVLNL